MTNTKDEIAEINFRILLAKSFVETILLTVDNCGKEGIKGSLRLLIKDLELTEAMMHKVADKL